MEEWLQIFLGILFAVLYIFTFPMAIIPIFCWVELVFTVPLFFADPIISIYYIIEYLNGKVSLDDYRIWLPIVSWFALPLADFLAIAFEIILIPSFIIGFPVQIVLNLLLFNLFI